MTHHKTAAKIIFLIKQNKLNFSFVQPPPPRKFIKK